eukprot:355982-Chlamydomonas_euryale.AAC.11
MHSVSKPSTHAAAALGVQPSAGGGPVPSSSATESAVGSSTHAAVVSMWHVARATSAFGHGSGGDGVVVAAPAGADGDLPGGSAARHADTSAASSAMRISGEPPDPSCRRGAPSAPPQPQLPPRPPLRPLRPPAPMQRVGLHATNSSLRQLAAARQLPCTCTRAQSASSTACASHSPFGTVPSMLSSCSSATAAEAAASSGWRGGAGASAMPSTAMTSGHIARPAAAAARRDDGTATCRPRASEARHCSTVTQHSTMSASPRSAAATLLLLAPAACDLGVREAPADLTAASRSGTKRDASHPVARSASAAIAAANAMRSARSALPAAAVAGAGGCGWPPRQHMAVARWRTVMVRLPASSASGLFWHPLRTQPANAARDRPSSAPQPPPPPPPPPPPSAPSPPAPLGCSIARHARQCGGCARLTDTADS